MQSVPRLYNEEQLQLRESLLRWQSEEYELVVRQSLASKGINRKAGEAEDIVEIHHQAMTGEDTAD
jgi:hypothetical protein